MVNCDLVEKVLRTIKTRTNLLSSDDVMLGVERLEAHAPLKRGITLNTAGIVVYLEGYTIQGFPDSYESTEKERAEFTAHKEGESGLVSNIAQQLLGVSDTDASELFGYPENSEVIAALEQLAAGADEVDWSKIWR